MQTENKWYKRFFELASLISTWSKDPNTKVGAVIVRPDNTICSTGFNGFPRNIADFTHHLNDRSEKLKRVLHAEENAILFSRERLDGYTLYSTLCPCNHCALLIIQSGIDAVVYTGITREWEDLTLELFHEAGVYYEKVI